MVPETENPAAYLGPAALVASGDGRTLLVALAEAGEIAWVDVAAGKLSRRVDVPGRPTGAAFWPDGSKLAVTCGGPESAVLLLDAATGRVLKRLAAGHTAMAPVVSPDGERLYVCNRFDHDVSVIDPAAGRELARVKVAREPVAAALSPDGNLLVVANHLPTGPANDFYVTAELTLVETGSLETRPVALPNGTSGLRGVAVSPDGRWALVTHVISNFELVTSQVDFGWMNTNRLSIVDATICYQHWQNCATCHPDGRADALNWDLMNDGVANPKNTKSMLLAHRTPPSMVTGVRPDAEAAVRAGFEHILFAEVPERDAAAVDVYLKALAPVPSPRLVDGRLSPAARRGRKLFESERVGCAVCHPAPHYTDLRRHKVGTRGPYDQRSSFDTPTLVECWRTGPYLHDGRYTSLEELLVEGRHGEGFGGAVKLSPAERQELIEYVLSL